MSKNEDRARGHKVFPAELQGATLVVAPRGDAVGFRDADIHAEMKRILELLDTPEVASLVVDLGAATYYGTVIIGSVTSFGQKARTLGRQAVLCNVSDEMLDVLRVMKLSDMWPKYRSQKDAVEACRRGAAGGTAAAGPRTN
jgi:anti-anti-sigma regulatory factor